MKIMFILSGLEGFVVLREHLTEHLAQLYDSFEVQSSTATPEHVTSLVNYTPQHSTAQVMIISKSTYQTVFNSSQFN